MVKKYRANIKKQIQIFNFIFFKKNDNNLVSKMSTNVKTNVYFGYFTLPCDLNEQHKIVK